MTAPMLEAVARAICRDDVLLAMREKDARFPEAAIQSVVDLLWPQFESKAIAALTALLSPTEEMVDAALAQDGQWSINAIPRVKRAYQAMIRTALGEKP